MKKLKINYRDPRDLNPHPRNSRKHSDQQISEIAESISEFGFNKPVMIDENDVILYGHGTVQASKLLDLDEIPTVDGSHMSDRQKRAFMIADNKLGHKSTWDIDLLSEELSDLAELEFDVSLTGFDEQELDGLLKNDESILPDTFESSAPGGPEPGETSDSDPVDAETRVTFHVSSRQADIIDAAISNCRELFGQKFNAAESTNRNSNAITFICERFNEEHGK